MQLGRAMSMFEPSANFGGVGHGTNKSDRLEWQDICAACAGMNDYIPWKLALIKYQNDWAVAPEVYSALVNWAKEVPWHLHAPRGKRFKVDDKRLSQLIRAAVWEYTRTSTCNECKGEGKQGDTDKDCGSCRGSGYSRLSAKQLSHRAEMARSTFTDWEWCYRVIASHVFVLEDTIVSRINRKLQ